MWLTEHREAQKRQLIWTCGILRDCTKVHTWVGTRLLHKYVADLQLVLHVSLEHMERGLSQKLCLLMRYILVGALPSLAWVGVDVPSPVDLMCQSDTRGTTGGAHSWRRREGGIWGRIVGGGWPGLRRGHREQDIM